MSLKKFKINKSGNYFFYHNDSHVLLDESMHPLTIPIQSSANLYNSQTFGSRLKSNDPHTIKISLGQGCNYDCKYCLQKDIGNDVERSANGLTNKLIDNIFSHINMHQLTRIELWGGESLLYWKDIMLLMQAFDSESMFWYIPTNGTLLDFKHIEFFSKLKGRVSIGISHDGPKHSQLRGEDFLDKKVELFKHIQNETDNIWFSFNPVISKTNYNLFAINDFFYDFLTQNGLNKVPLNFELCRVYDLSQALLGTHHVISGDDLPLFEKILTDYLNDHIALMQTSRKIHTRLLVSNFVHMGLGIIPNAKSLNGSINLAARTNCGVDDLNSLSIDISGNVRTCQNVSETHISGNITKLQNVDLVGVDIKRIHHNCDTCLVKRLCKGSCPLTLGKEPFNINCKIEKLLYTTIQLATFRFLFTSDIEVVD